VHTEGLQLLLALTLATILAGTFARRADAAPAGPLVLPSSIADGAVLQRDVELTLRGHASPGQTVSVAVAGRQAQCAAAPDGTWSLRLPPLDTGGPHEMEIRVGGQATVLQNLLVGDVWLCSGQSNMETPVWAALNAEEEIRAADWPRIRLFRTARTVAQELQPDVEGHWAACTPETVAGFSAVGYYFGRELHRELDVPIGLIDSSWSGTPAESWVSMPALLANPAFADIVARYDDAVARAPEAARQYQLDMADWQVAADAAAGRGEPAPPQPEPPMGAGNPWLPSGLYNTMIAPLAPYALRGAIWYQGESNTDRAYQYRELLPALIADWRRTWAQGDFPFLIVQLANYMALQTVPAEQSPWAELREAQAMTLAVPNTAMAVTIDIGDADDIHPKNKQEVGRRLALAALATVYGRDLTYSGPAYESMAVDGPEVVLRLTHVDGGLVAKGDVLRGFALAGEDRQFRWADARIEGNTVVLSSDAVPAPVAARYSWANNPVGNLYNAAGLPAGPFRTDDWPGATRQLTPEELAELYPQPEPVDVPYAAGEVPMDAEAAAWADVPLVRLPFLSRTSESLRLCWREDGIYGRVDVTDSAIAANMQTPWAADSVELFFDRAFNRGPSRDRTCSQYVFSPAPDRGPGQGHSMVAYGPGQYAIDGLQCTWTPGGNGYTMTFFIAAAMLEPAAMQEGTRMGFNYALNNDGDAVEQFYSDKDKDSGWGRPVTWGCIRLAR
jgi:sialate O-acetylesterase